MWHTAFLIALSLTTLLRAADMAWLSLSPGTIERKANPRWYGLNVWDGMDPAVAGNASWRARMGELSPPLLRFHAGEQLTDGARNSWVDHATRSWKRDAIAASLAGTAALSAERLITITGWPSWMDGDGDGKLDEWQKDAYAAFCADLVRLVRQDLKVAVGYWETFNEKDGVYRSSSDLWHLADIHKRCWMAMKAVDGSIRIGAGAWSQPYDAGINDFLWNLGGGYLDLWTHHQYGGDGSLGSRVYDSAQWIIDGATAMRSTLNAKGYGSIPMWIDEYNIFWSWDQDGANWMTGAVGAVFDALVIRHAARTNGIDGLCAWQESGLYGSRYAKINYSWDSWSYDRLLPGGQVLRLYREHGTGDVVASTGGNGVDTVAFHRNDNTRKLVLVTINRSGSERTLYLDNGPWTWRQRHLVTANGVSTSQNPSLYYANQPADSVAFYVGIRR